MKISQKQAELLAMEIHSRLLKMNIGAVSPLLKAKIEKFKDERNVLVESNKKIEKQIEEHDKKLKQIVGKQLGNIRSYYDADDIIEKLEAAATPSIDQIENKIILKSMFATADDMESFVDTLVNEFVKKSKKSVVAN